MKRSRELPRVDAGEALVVLALGLWITVTALSQHPQRAFDRFRDYDPTSVYLPNWRFFAPEPARNDYEIGYRVKHVNGEVSAWSPARSFTERKPHHLLWFPKRREDKAVFDVVSRLLMDLRARGEGLVHSIDYRLLRNHVKRHVREVESQVAGFQFCFARSEGYAEGDLEVLFISPYEPLDESAQIGATK